MKAFDLKRISANILLVLLFSYSFYCLIYIYNNLDTFHLDFKSQYHAAKVFFDGGNPYDSETLKSVSGTPWWYAYPPATLWFFGIFTIFDYTTAATIFLTLKVAVTTALVFLWKREFISQRAGLAFYLFILLAFNSAVFRDLRAGNINMFEEFFIWFGFYFFLKHRYFLFCLFILVASSFKITPIFFLVLLFFSFDKNRTLYLFSSLIAFALYLALQYYFVPLMFNQFFFGAKNTLIENGAYSPSTYAFIKDFFYIFSKNTDISISTTATVTIYYIISIFIILTSFKAFSFLKPIDEERKEKIFLLFICVVYALIHPRMKNYAYVLLIVPSFYIITKGTYKDFFPFIFLLSVLSAELVILPGFKTIFALFWSYHSLFVAYMIWLLYLLEIHYNFNKFHKNLTVQSSPVLLK